ncbi:MAG: HepT-like ribonuclease domain-containing protein [Phycisphaerales bacterium]
MLDYAREAVAMAHDRKRGDLDTDRMFELALVRLVEIVGEAATRIDAPTRAKIPALPWRDICDTRNRIIHGYDQVNFDVLWEIVQDDLPPLILALSTFLDVQPHR